MVQIVKPQQVQINTKNGELLVHLLLDINLNLGSGVKLNLGGDEQTEDKEVDKVNWEIPDFTSSRVKFGKAEKA